jgi:hypothetical protein
VASAQTQVPYTVDFGWGPAQPTTAAVIAVTGANGAPRVAFMALVDNMPVAADRRCRART